MCRRSVGLPAGSNQSSPPSHAVLPFSRTVAPSAASPARPRAARPKGGMVVLRAMHREWPFFAALLSNMDMVLAKSDIAIASRYAELVTDRSQVIFSRMRAEWWIRGDAAPIMGHETLLEGYPLLARSIAAGSRISIP